MRSLLIPLMYFFLQTCLETARVKRLVVLDMVPDAFDDQYIGCTDEMDNYASALLKDEKSRHNRLKKVWDNAESTWANGVKQKLSLPTNFKDEYGTAIVAYTNSTSLDNVVFSTEFNQAVRGNGTSQAHYMAKFHFKAFHYYLTRALQLLRGKCYRMYKQTVYRGIPDEYSHSGGFIRFGQFASSSLDEQVAKRFAKEELRGTYTVFTINTCFGVDISIFNPKQKEVLIPVHEMFEVCSGNVLKSTKQTCSYFNCAYLDREKNKTCVNNTATRGGVAFPGGMSPSLFGGSVILIHAAALKLTAGF